MPFGSAEPVENANQTRHYLDQNVKAWLQLVHRHTDKLTDGPKTSYLQSFDPGT